MHYFIMQNPFSFFPHLSHSLAYFSIIISHCAGASFVLQLHLYFFVVVFFASPLFFPPLLSVWLSPPIIGALSQA